MTQPLPADLSALSLSKRSPRRRKHLHALLSAANLTVLSVAAAVFLWKLLDLYCLQDKFRYLRISNAVFDVVRTVMP